MPSGPFACRGTSAMAATGAALSSAGAARTQARPSHTGVEKLYPVIASNDLVRDKTSGA